MWVDLVAYAAGVFLALSFLPSPLKFGGLDGMTFNQKRRIDLQALQATL